MPAQNSSSSKADPRTTPLFLFAASLFVRVAVLVPVLLADTPLMGDEQGYFARAAAYLAILGDLIRGRAPSSEDLTEAYGAGLGGALQPLILALPFAVFGTSITAARVTVVFLSALTTPVVYRLTLKLSTKRAALFAAFAHIVYPSFVAFSHYLMSETLYILIFLLAVSSAVSVAQASDPRQQLAHALRSGCWLGLSGITRAAALPVMILVPLWVAWRLKKVRWAPAALVAAELAFLLPWQGVLFAREGRLVPASVASGYMLYLGNSPWSDPDDFEPDARLLIDPVIRDYAREHRVSEDIAARKLALDEIRGDVPSFVRRCFDRLRHLWNTDQFVLRHVLHLTYPPLGDRFALSVWALLWVSFALFTGLAIWGLVAATKPLPYRPFFLILIGAGTLPPVVMVAATRYALPFLALLLPAVGHGASHLRPPRAFAGLVALILAGLVAINTVTYPGGRRLSPKTSSHYRAVVQRLDAWLGSDTPFSDQIILRVPDPTAVSRLHIEILTPGYRFHDVHASEIVLEVSPERARFPLSLYGYSPTARPRLRLVVDPWGRSVAVDPVRPVNWRRWESTALQGVEYRWTGGGLPPPKQLSAPGGDR